MWTEGDAAPAYEAPAYEAPKKEEAKEEEEAEGTEAEEPTEEKQEVEEEDQEPRVDTSKWAGFESVLQPSDSDFFSRFASSADSGTGPTVDPFAVVKAKEEGEDLINEVARVLEAQLAGLRPVRDQVGRRDHGGVGAAGRAGQAQDGRGGGGEAEEGGGRGRREYGHR